jgi:hypothetical protein
MAYDKEQHKREMAALRKFAVLLQAFDDRISVQKAYVDITEDHLAALVLDEIIFFTLPRDGGQSGLRVWKEGHLWLASTREQWWERKRLTPRQVDGAIAKLLKKNLVFKEIYRFNGHGTIHLRLNIAEFFRQYSQVIKSDEEDVPATAEEMNDLLQMVVGEETPSNSCTDLENGCPDNVYNNEMVTLVSPNGETNNILHNNLHYIPPTAGESSDTPKPASGNGRNGKFVPPANWPIDHHLAAGGPIDQAVLAAEQERKMLAAAQKIAMYIPNTQLAMEIVMAFQTARGMVIPDVKVKHARKVVGEMIAVGIRPQHVIQAVNKLLADGLPCPGIHSVYNLAFDYASPKPAQFGQSAEKVRVL